MFPGGTKQGVTGDNTKNWKQTTTLALRVDTPNYQVSCDLACKKSGGNSGDGIRQLASSVRQGQNSTAWRELLEWLLRCEVEPRCGKQFAEYLARLVSSVSWPMVTKWPLIKARDCVFKLNSMKHLDERKPEGWVLYDGSCGFCSRWVPFCEETLKKRGFRIAPLQSDWVAGELNLPKDELVSDLRLLLANREQLRGAEVYRYLMKRIWWAKPLYLLSILPVLRTLFDAGYRVFADNRYWISRACHLPALDESKQKYPH